MDGTIHPLLTIHWAKEKQDCWYHWKINYCTSTGEDKSQPGLKDYELLLAVKDQADV